MSARLSYRTVGRLSTYRHVLTDLLSAGKHQAYSHELASVAGVTAAQVRRDLMAIQPIGSPTSGYNIPELISSITALLDDPQGLDVVLVGIGNLGRAVLAYMAGRRPNLKIVAAFDTNPQKVNRVIHGCRCYPLDDLEPFLAERRVQVGVITVPAEAAQGVAELLVAAGVRGLVNFAPAPLRVPPHVYVEHLDVTMTLEKVAFFARQAPAARNPAR